MKHKSILVGLTLLLVLEISAAPLGNCQQLLQITAPSNRSLATEGTTINITVSADPSVTAVGILVGYPLPNVQPTSSANQFTLTLPTTIPPGLYTLTAVGMNASGDVESAPVAIDVEPKFVPTGIVANPPWLNLVAIGDQYPIRVIGTFVDGSTLDVTGSSRTVFSSNNTQVATVSSSGMITAVGPGQTGILVQAGISPSYTYSAVMVTVPQPPPSGANPKASAPSAGAR